MKKIHYILGYSGLIPFIGLSITTMLGDTVSNMILLSYACLIASFLGGTLWMSSIEHKLPSHVAISSNLFMLLAWTILILQTMDGIFYLASALFIGLICYERRYLKHLYSAKYMRLRTILSGVVAACLLLVAIYKQSSV